MSKTTLALLFVLALSACAPIVDTHGNMVTQLSLQEIQPLVSTRADVEGKWGPPTTVSSFDPNTWYYIGETTSRKGIFEAEVAARRMVKVTFGPDSIVTSVSMLDPKLAQDVDIVDRKTPTAGKEFTAFQQFVGNIGKFNNTGDMKGK